MIKEIEVKSISYKAKNPFSWFGIVYNANFYRGCPHKCIYCDSRSECYQVNNFDDIEVKINAPELLRNELSKRRIKGTIGTGSMTDPYLPIERIYRLTRKCLEVINEYDYPVVIITKSNLVLDDIDLIESINKKNRATVIFTITTIDDNLAKIIEPNAPLPIERLGAIEELSKRGIYVGVLMMPILPFINDNEENIQKIVQSSAYYGAKFIIPGFGVTLRDRQREYYYHKLDEHYKGLKEKYIKIYHNSYMCTSKNYKKLYRVFKSECLKYKLVYEMGKVQTWERINNNIQLGLFKID